jgi:ABC-type uncharacterized transport system YnjBCD substrate-binding protein
MATGFLEQVKIEKLVKKKYSQTKYPTFVYMWQNVFQFFVKLGNYFPPKNKENMQPIFFSSFVREFE